MIRSRFAQKSLKYLAIAIGAGFVLLLLGATLLMMSSNTQFVKNYLSRIMLESRQRTLAIDGDLSWSFSMTPAINLRIGHASLSERNATQTFATSDGAQASLRLWPLLSRQIVLERLELTGLKANLIRHADGTLNINDLLTSQQHDAALPSFSISGVRIADAEFSWLDEITGQRMTLAGIRLDSGRIANAANDALESSLRLLTPQGDEISIKLKGRYDFDIQAPRFSFGNIDAQISAPRIGGLREVAIALAIAEVGLPGADGRALKIGKLALQFAATSESSRYSGRLDTPLVVDLAARTLQLENLVGELTFAGPTPTLPPLSFTGNLRADFMRQTAEGKLTGQFADSHIVADISVMKISPLSAVVDLDVDHFDADRYLPASTGRRSDTSFDPALLEHLDLRGTLRISRFHVAGATVRNLRVDIRKAFNGDLDIAHQVDVQRQRPSPRNHANP